MRDEFEWEPEWREPGNPLPELGDYVQVRSGTGQLHEGL